MQNPTLFKSILGIGLLSISFAACQKNSPSLVGRVVESKTPQRHDGDFSYQFFANEKIPTATEDKKGNIVLLSELKKNSKFSILDACSENYDDCETFFRGGQITNICFNGGGSSSNTTFSLSWDIEVPDGINLVNDASNYVRLRLTPSGFSSSPSGTGNRTLSVTFTYLEDYYTTGLSTGTLSLHMRKYRVTSNLTNFNVSDFCVNNDFITSYRIETDCSDLPFLTIIPALTHYMDFNQRQVPLLFASNATVGSNHRFEIVTSQPLCTGPGCKSGPAEFSYDYELKYRPYGISGTWTTVTRNTATSFYVSGLIAGGYEYQMRAKINFAGQTVYWSDWTASQTVNVL